MASIGIGIGIEDPILQVLVLVLVLNFGNCQVLVLVLVLTLGSSEVLVLVLVSEKWYCPSLVDKFANSFTTDCVLDRQKIVRIKS